jgi:prepilin-type N-terminal cleavage/methylation domain-containing protein
MRSADFRIDIQNVELRTPNSNGFTLIETIITLVVLSIAVIGVLSVFTTGMKGGANPLIASQATQYAQGEMDQIFGEKAGAGGFGSIINGSCVLTLAGFNCSRTVCYVTPADLNSTAACGVATNYKHVTVTVNQPLIGDIKVDSLISNY